MNNDSSLNHSRWECKYHVVWIPKYRRKRLYGKLRQYLGHRRNFTGQQFWARGYHVSTVGRDEATVREYIRSQEAEDRRIDQLSLFR